MLRQKASKKKIVWILHTNYGNNLRAHLNNQKGRWQVVTAEHRRMCTDSQSPFRALVWTEKLYTNEMFPTDSLNGVY